MSRKAARTIFAREALPERRRAMRLKLDVLSLLDRSIKPIGTAGIIAGVGAYVLGASIASDYLIAGGVLFHIASWFGDWWTKK